MGCGISTSTATTPRQQQQQKETVDPLGKVAVPVEEEVVEPIQKPYVEGKYSGAKRG